MKIQIGDRIKFDNYNSNMTWIGTVVSVAEKSVKAITGLGCIERVKIKNIVKVY